MKKDLITLPRLIEKVFEIEEGSILLKSRKKNILQARITYTVLLRYLQYSFNSIYSLTFQKCAIISRTMEQFRELLGKDLTFNKKFMAAKALTTEKIYNNTLLIPQHNNYLRFEDEFEITYIPHKPIPIKSFTLKFPILRSIAHSEFVDILNRVPVEENERFGINLKARNDILKAVNHFDMQISLFAVSLEERFFIINLLSNPFNFNLTSIEFATFKIYETTLDGYLDHLLEDKTVGIQYESIQDR